MFNQEYKTPTSILFIIMDEKKEQMIALEKFKVITDLFPKNYNLVIIITIVD